MSLWGRIFAANYDHIMSRAESAGLAAHRRALLVDAAGDVLEIGAGTGANLPFYGEGVRSLTVTEPEAPMVRRLQLRLQQINVRMAHGCRCNRRTVDGIRSAGFEVIGIERDELKHVPPFVRPLVVGAAARAA